MTSANSEGRSKALIMNSEYRAGWLRPSLASCVRLTGVIYLRGTGAVCKLLTRRLIRKQVEAMAAIRSSRRLSRGQQRTHPLDNKH